MTSGCANVVACGFGSPTRGIAAAMHFRSSPLEMTDTAGFAALVSAGEVCATLCFTFDRRIGTLLTTLDKGFVPTGRYHVFDIKLAFNRGKVRHLMAGHFTCGMTTT